MCRDTPKMLLPVEILVFMAFVFVSCFHVYNKWLKQWLGDGSSCGGGNEVDCVVCLSKVSKGEKLRALPICKHSFHVHCIDAWLKVRPTCPLCRISVAPDRNFLVSSLLTSAKTVGKLIGNPLSLELAAAVSESLGYI